MTREEYIQRRQNGESKEQIIASWQSEKRKIPDGGEKSGSSNFSPEVQEYLDEYGRVAASGMNEVDYYNDQRSKLQARIEEELQADMKRKGINPRSPMGQQYANMYMSYALDASPEYQLANSMYNQAYTAQREKDLAAQTKAEQQKVADFSNAMQQYDTVTGLPLDNSGRVAADYSGGDRNQKTQMDWSFGQWGSPEEWFNYGK